MLPETKATLSRYLTTAILSLAILSVGIIVGVKWERSILQEQPPLVTTVLIEVPFELPPKHESKPLRPLQPSASRIDRIDEVIGKAKRADSLEQMLESALAMQVVEFDDTVAFADSSGSFFVRELHSILIDPMTDWLANKTTMYLDGKLTLKEKHISTVSLERPSFLERFAATWDVGLLAFLLGALIGAAVF